MTTANQIETAPRTKTTTAPCGADVPANGSHRCEGCQASGPGYWCADRWPARDADAAEIVAVTDNKGRPWSCIAPEDDIGDAADRIGTGGFFK